MQIVLRKTIAEDAASLANLSVQLGYKSTLTQIQKRLPLVLNDENHCVITALSEEKILGFIHATYCLNIISDAFIEINALIVDENVRNAGVGKALISEIKHWAAQKNCFNLRVRCNTKRKETHQFYEHLGFKELKEQKVFAFSL